MTEGNDDKPGRRDEPDTPGYHLRAARLERGLSVQQAAAELRLDHWMVEALEADDYSEFGAPVFAKGHMRKYATLLGIDPDELMIGYYRVQAPETPPLVSASNIPAEAAGGSGSWLRTLLVAVLVIGLLGLLWWGWMAWSGRAGQAVSGAAAVQPSIPEPQSRTDSAEPAAPDVGPPGGALAPGSDEDASPTPQLDPESPSGVAGAMAPEAPAGLPEELADVAASALQQGVRSGELPDDAASGAPADEMDNGGAAADEIDGFAEDAASSEPRINRRIYTGDADLDIRLRFIEESWVEVRDGLDRRLLYGLGRAGTVETLAVRAPIEVFLGNFPGVSIEVDGRPFNVPLGARRGNIARFRVAASE